VPLNTRKAYCLLRPEPPIRRESFYTGLTRAGFEVRSGPPPTVEDCALLVIWNRYGENHHHALRVEAAGGRVLVAENGYLGVGGTAPKFDLDTGMRAEHYIALALGGHNGSGAWPKGDASRWAALGVALQPWRDSGRNGGEHIVVCPNRSFGRPDLLMPADWATQVVRRLQRITGRPVVVRPHPGTHAPKRALVQDLANAWACVIWSSSAGVHALAAGIPVISEAPAWICKGAAGHDLAAIETPAMPERQPHFERLAWAQWTFSEIAAGDPFKHLLGNP